MPSPQDHGETFTIMEKTRTPDGMGGYYYQWTDGLEFQGLASLDSSVEAIIAEKTAAYIRFHLQLDKSVPVEINDYIKRQSDGATFQVKSDPNENQTPTDASLSFKEFDLVKAPLPL